MNAYTVENQLNEVLKGAFWRSNHSSDFRRLYNFASSKKKPLVTRIISEALADKLVQDKYAGSYKRFFSAGDFKPYALFFHALFAEHMKKELTEVLKLVVFSESAGALGSRKAIELAMKSYQKAIGWNESKAEEALVKMIQTIETYDYKQESPEPLRESLAAFVDAEVKTSKNIVSIKAYSRLVEMRVHFQNTDIHELVIKAYNKACYLI